MARWWCACSPDPHTAVAGPTGVETPATCTGLRNVPWMAPVSEEEISCTWLAATWSRNNGL